MRDNKDFPNTMKNKDIRAPIIRFLTIITIKPFLSKSPDDGITTKSVDCTNVSYTLRIMQTAKNIPK